jgi:signal transduction histidine kinase
VKLRARVAVTAAAVLVPVLVGLVLLFRTARMQMAEEGLAAYARATAGVSEAACEAAPGRVSVELYAYDAELRAAHAGAPVLPAEVVAEARRVGSTARRVDGGLEVVVRAREAGACAYVLARRGAEAPGPGAGLHGPVPGVAVVSCALLLLVVLAALGPIVRRIRRLRDEVRATAAAGYSQAMTVRGDDELGELAAAFEASRRQLAHHLEAQAGRERALREFLANTTHDVMVPLTVLQGHLVALQAGSDAGALRAAMQEADYIAALVHNLEVAARLDAGEPELILDRVELAPLVGRVTQRLLPLARRRGIELAHAVPRAAVTVVGDVTMIERALSNLVHNSLLHNHADGHVAVVLEMDDARSFRIVVKDDGPGMGAEELTRVLERGERGKEARTRHPHGKGLGLAIARRVAAAHAWQFTLRPGAEGGLEVELRGAVLAG